MIQVNREYDSALRIEASAETRSGPPGGERCSWWLIAELGAVAGEDRIFSAEQRGSLVYDRRGTYLFAVGDRCEAAPPVGQAMTRRALQDTLRSVPAGHPLRCDVENPGIHDGAFLGAVEKLVCALHERTHVEGGEGVGALAVVRWPDLFLVPGGATLGYVMHDGRLRRLADQYGTQPHRQTDRCLAAVATAGLAGRLPFERNVNDSASSAIVRVSLAFGDVLLLCSPTVANYVTEAQMARVVRAGVNSRMAAGTLLDVWQQCCYQREATTLVARFTFRPTQEPSLTDTTRM